jgi:hypothetical protein
LLEAVRFAIASWDDVPGNVIQNCWIKCGKEFVEMDDDEQTTEEVVDAVEYPAQVNNESESDEEPVISASEGLSCCL